MRKMSGGRSRVPASWCCALLSVMVGLGSVAGSVASVLSDVAASMAPGTWAELSGVSDLPLSSNVASNNHLTYALGGVWDAASDTAWYVGNGHLATGEPLLFKYTASTNTWTLQESLNLYTFSHGYDHLSYNPWTRELYLRAAGNSRNIHRWPIAGPGPSSLMTTFPGSEFVQVALGTDYFEGLYGTGEAASLAQGALVVWSCGDNPSVLRFYNPRTNTWTSQDVTNANTGYDCILQYSRPLNVAVFGGGNSASQKIWRLAPDKTVTALPDAPLSYGSTYQAAKLYPDPRTGRFLLMGNQVMYELDPLGSGLWTQQTGGRVPPSALGNPAANERVAIPIPEYGVLYVLRCFGPSTACTHYLYKHGAAAEESWYTKSRAAGVIAAWKPTDTDLYRNWPTGGPCDTTFSGRTSYSICSDKASCKGNTLAVVQNGACVAPTFDATQKASGAGSLKFTIPSNSGANTSGNFMEPLQLFRRTSPWMYIAPGSPDGNVLYVQYKQRFDTNFLTIDYQCNSGSCGGWKQSIIYGNPPNGSDSSTIEITGNNGWQRNVPQVYGQQGSDDYGIEDIRGCTYANATSQGGSGSGYASRANYQAPLNPTCLHFTADTWMEFTYRIEVLGGTPNTATSRVQLWVDGQLAVDEPNAKVNWGSADGDGVGSWEWLPYHTDKNSGHAHATGATWYDELIVSTSAIAMAGAQGLAFLSDPSGVSPSSDGAVTFPSEPTSLSPSGTSTPGFPANPTGVSPSGNTSITFLNNPSGVGVVSP